MFISWTCFFDVHNYALSFLHICVSHDTNADVQFSVPFLYDTFFIFARKGERERERERERGSVFFSHLKIMSLK